MSGHPDEPRQAPRRLFEEAVAGLDADTGKRLRLMRREAIAGARREPAARWLPAVAFAALVLALGLGWRLARPPAPTVVVPSEVASPAELAAEDDAELYAWLGEAPVAVEEKPL